MIGSPWASSVSFSHVGSSSACTGQLPAGRLQRGPRAVPVLQVPGAVRRRRRGQQGLPLGTWLGSSMP